MLHVGMLLLGVLAFQRENKAVIEERFQVGFVVIDVVAVTKKGELVTDLTQADFEVREGKNVVPVTFFEILDFRPGAKPAAPSAPLPENLEPGATAAAPPGQQIVIAVDFESVLPEDLNRAFAQLKEYLTELSNDPNRPSKINLYAMDRGSLTKGFTTHVADAISALETYRESHITTRKSGGLYDSDIPGVGSAPRGLGASTGGMSALARTVNDFADLERAFSECLNWGRDSVCGCINDTYAQFTDEQRTRSERMIGELEILAYKFEANNDLKTMLVISPGFVLSRIRAAERMASLFGEPAGCGRGGAALGERLDINANFNRVVHACIKNRVVFHTFDLFNAQRTQGRSFSAEYQAPPTGELADAYRDYEREVTEGLEELAHESGGTFKQVFKVDGAFGKTLEENRFFYTLGYQSPPGEKGKFRKIEVEVKRKGVKLRHRRGYFGP